MNLKQFITTKLPLDLQNIRIGKYLCINNNHSDIDYEYTQKIIKYKIDKTTYILYSFTDAFQKWDNKSYGYTTPGYIKIKYGLFQSYDFTLKVLPKNVYCSIEENLIQFQQLMNEKFIKNKKIIDKIRQKKNNKFKSKLQKFLYSINY